MKSKGESRGRVKEAVEQRDKWEHQAGKSKGENEKLEKDLRQELRTAKLAATTCTQTQDPPPLQFTKLNHQTAAEVKPTCTSVATQADLERKDKGKGRAVEPAPTAAGAASPAEDIEMKDWSPYEDLRMRRNWHPELHPLRH